MSLSRTNRLLLPFQYTHSHVPMRTQPSMNLCIHCVPLFLSLYIFPSSFFFFFFFLSTGLYSDRKLSYKAEKGKELQHKWSGTYVLDEQVGQLPLRIPPFLLFSFTTAFFCVVVGWINVLPVSFLQHAFSIYTYIWLCLYSMYVCMSCGRMSRPISHLPRFAGRLMKLTHE